MMISPLHAAHVEEFLSDLADAVARHGISQKKSVGYN
jgi:hypothetical protein